MVARSGSGKISSTEATSKLKVEGFLCEFEGARIYNLLKIKTLLGDEFSPKVTNSLLC
jgi:hypothetical protein